MLHRHLFQVTIILDLSHHLTLISPSKLTRLTDWKKFKNIMNSTVSPPSNLHISTYQQIQQESNKSHRKYPSSYTSVTNPKNLVHNLPKTILREISLKRRQRSSDPQIKTLLKKKTSLVYNLLSSHNKNQRVFVLGSLNEGT